MENPEVVEIDALHQAHEAHAVLGIRLRPITSACPALDGFNEKESAPPFKVVVPAQCSPKHRPQMEIVSVDETRLLGGRPKRDPDAVTIVKPSANQSNTYKQNLAIPCGFHPKNTLGQSSSPHQAPARGHSLGFPRFNGRKRNQLAIEVSVGDNVKSASQKFESLVPMVGEPHPKRKKLGSPHNPVDYLAPPSSNDSDLGQQPGDQACENDKPSSTPEKIKKFTKPQKIMDSKKAKPRCKTNGQKTGNTVGSFLRSPDATRTQAPVEIKLHNTGLPPISRSTYKGTARADPSAAFRSASAAKGTSQHEFGGKSKYFLPDRGTEGQPLRNQFRDCNGRRRTSDEGNLSSDELESGTTVGNHAIINLSPPDKRSCSISPAKKPVSTLNAPSSEDGFGGLAPSTIPSTKFWTGTNRRRQPISSPPISVDFRLEEINSWGIGLNFIVGTDKILIKGPDLGLDFNSKHRVYHVQLQGKKQSSSHQIDPKSVTKAIVAKGGTKLRFDFPANKIIYVETFTEFDAYAFLRHMESIQQLLKIEWKSSEWMDKAIDRRLAENSSPSKNPRRAGEDEPLDVQMAKMNKQRRDETQRAVTISDEHNSKRRRQRLLDGMREEEYNNARVQAGPGQMETKDQIDDITASNSNRLDQDPLDVSRFSRRIHQRSPNPHLSGSRTQPYRSSRQARQPAALEETLQKFIPHKPADLGTPWRKPLLFPKDGKKKASVEFSDLERLEEAEFLNDNLIGFYLRYLEQRLEETQPEIAKKVYFFNTFFFASLTNTQRGRRGINYEAVQNWTRSVDIFAFDYVVVPINESAHWYLAIICNLPALLPEFAATKSSAEVGDTCSLHSEQYVDDNSVAAAVFSDQPSSPISEVTYMEHAHSTVNKPEEEPDLEDHAPTASFAEMSLDIEPNNGSPVIDSCVSNFKSNHPELRVEEQGMLDAQINDDLAQVTCQTGKTASLRTKDAEPIENEEGSVPSQDQRVHFSAKKRKRKSVAPIQRINPDSPAIITFDSLGLTHPQTIRALKDYLREEGRAKRGLEWDEPPIKGVTAKDIPEQNNLCDCGLFLLGYVDKFLDNPKEFTSKILARQYDVQKDWPRLNPSTLRVSIRKQIIDLHKEQHTDRRENARKSDKDLGKESNTDKIVKPKDSAQVKIGREETQSPHPTPPSLRSSPQLEIDSRRGMSKKEASESALEMDVCVKTKPAEAHSPHPTPPSRPRSPQLEINPRKGMTRKEALEGATEIGAPDPQKLIISFENDNGEDSRFTEDGADSHIQRTRLGCDLDNEPIHAAANDVDLGNEGTRQLDAIHRFRSSRSVDSTDVVDHAQEAVEMPSVIEDSEPDSLQEILPQELSAALPRAKTHKAAEGFEQDFYRSPPTALEQEKHAPVDGRLARPSNTRKQRERIIDLDSC